MTLKSDSKFEEKLSCHFKIDMIKLMNFHSSTGKPENLNFDGLLAEFLLDH